MTAPLCFIDTETDGIHAGRRIWEVAMIRRDHTPDGPVETTTSFFVGIDLRNSDPYGLKVGGYWDRHPAGRKISGKDPLPGPPPMCKHDAAKTIMAVTFGTHLVGINPAFDADTLTGLLRSEGYIPGWHYHVLDVSALAIGWLHGSAAPVPATPPWKSATLSAECGVEPPTEGDRHTALGDARWAARWYDTITGSAA